MAKVLPIDRSRPDPELIAQAVAVVRSGGIVAYLTDTLYGLGVDPFIPEAVQRIFTMKSRVEEKALPLIIGGREVLPRLVREIPPVAEVLADRFWPGPLSLILPASPVLPPILLGYSSTIAVRWPASPVASTLALAAGGALTATSANRSDAAPARTAQEVVAVFGSDVDLVLDSGSATELRPSTMVDVTAVPPRIVREGPITSESIQRILNPVHETGNPIPSPVRLQR